MGNQSAREALSRAAERQITEEEYEAVKEKAHALGLVVKGNQWAFRQHQQSKWCLRAQQAA